MRKTATILFISILWLVSSWAQGVTTYVVQQGDSVYAIAKKFGVTVQAIQQANQLTDPRKIKIGQHLNIPTTLTAPPPAAHLSPPPIPVVPPTPQPPAKPISQPISPVSPPTNKSTPAEGDDAAASERQYVFLDSVKDLIDLPHVVPGRWRYIVLHHSATSQGSAKVFDIAHRERGMENGLAYHFVIGNGTLTGDGQIEVGNRWLKQLKGGHLAIESLNQISIGICFVGNFDETRPTKKQIAAAIELISYLRKICGPPVPILMTHTEIHPHHTECPGKYFPTEAFHTLFPGDPDQAELARLRAIPN